MCCAGWYYCTAQMDKVGTSSHFVISFQTKHHQISGNSCFERIFFLMAKSVMSLFVILKSNHPGGSHGSQGERDSDFYDWYWLSNTPVIVTNPLLHCTQVRKCRLYIDFHYTVECFKDALENHRCSLPSGGARCCLVQRSPGFSSSLIAHETTVAQSDTVHQHYPLLIYPLVTPS